MLLINISAPFSSSHIPAPLIVTINNCHFQSSCFHSSLLTSFCMCFLFLEPKLSPICGSFRYVPFHKLCTIISGPNGSTVITHQIMSFHIAQLHKTNKQTNEKQVLAELFRINLTIYTWISTKITFFWQRWVGQKNVKCGHTTKSLPPRV